MRGVARVRLRLRVRVRVRMTVVMWLAVVVGVIEDMVVGTKSLGWGSADA